MRLAANPTAPSSGCQGALGDAILVAQQGDSICAFANEIDTWTVKLAAVMLNMGGLHLPHRAFQQRPLYPLAFKPTRAARIRAAPLSGVTAGEEINAPRATPACRTDQAGRKLDLLADRAAA